MEAEYRLRWAGYRMKDAQALSFPRYGIPKRDAPGGYAAMPAYYDNASVPAEAQKACAILALAATSGDLNGELSPTVRRETIGPITTEFAPGAPERRRFPQVEQILAPLFKSAAGNGSMVLTRA
jgi:hypothetical protein